MRNIHVLLLSLFFSVALFSGILFYQNHQFSLTRAEFSSAILDLSVRGDQLYSELSDLNSDFVSKSSEIDGAFSAVESSLSRLGQDIVLFKQETDLIANKLSGELNLVKQESSEKFDELENKLMVNLKSSDFSGLVQDVIKGVVSVKTDKSVGSGVIFDSDGYIVSNYHVVDSAISGSVRTSDGVVHAVSIIGFDKRKDIAVLKIDGSFNRLRFANSDVVDVGQRVLALGSPAGLDFSVNEGIISARRVIDGLEFFQTDVAMNPGNSGGPLVDASGRIVGINNFKLKDYEGLNFAISSNEVKAVVDVIMSKVD